MRESGKIKNRNEVNKNNLTTSMPGIIDEKQTLNLDKLIEKISYQFDYEVNNIKLDNNDEMNSKMYYYSTETKSYRILNYNSFNDKLLPVYKIIPNKKNKKKSPI